VCGAQGGICKYIFFNPVGCCFLYKAKDLSAPLVFDHTDPDAEICGTDLNVSRPNCDDQVSGNVSGDVGGDNEDWPPGRKITIFVYDAIPCLI
jgi:hypothetical protein